MQLCQGRHHVRTKAVYTDLHHIIKTPIKILVDSHKDWSSILSYIFYQIKAFVPQSNHAWACLCHADISGYTCNLCVCRGTTKHVHSPRLFSKSDELATILLQQPGDAGGSTSIGVCPDCRAKWDVSVCFQTVKPHLLFVSEQNLHWQCYWPSGLCEDFHERCGCSVQNVSLYSALKAIVLDSFISARNLYVCLAKNPALC